MISRAATLAFILRARLLVGQTYGGWRLDSFLGAGSFGASFLGSNSRGDSAVLKLLRPNARLDNLEREADAFQESARNAPSSGNNVRSTFAARRTHSATSPGNDISRMRVWTECAALQQCEGSGLIPRWHGIVNERGRYFIVLERMPGESLASLLAKHYVFSDEEIGVIARDTTAAVAFAHEHGIAHNDLRPANVLFDIERNRASLIDFGLATFFPSSRARTDFPASSAIDRSGIADILLHALYSRYEGPRTNASWREELSLPRAQCTCLNALFADIPPYRSWSETRDAIAKAFPASPG